MAKVLRSLRPARESWRKFWDVDHRSSEFYTNREFKTVWESHTEAKLSLEKEALKSFLQKDVLKRVQQLGGFAVAGSEAEMARIISGTVGSNAAGTAGAAANISAKDLIGGMEPAAFHGFHIVALVLPTLLVGYLLANVEDPKQQLAHADGKAGAGAVPPHSALWSNKMVLDKRLSLLEQQLQKQQQPGAQEQAQQPLHLQVEGYAGSSSTGVEGHASGRTGGSSSSSSSWKDWLFHGGKGYHTAATALIDQLEQKTARGAGGSGAAAPPSAAAAAPAAARAGPVEAVPATHFASVVAVPGSAMERESAAARLAALEAEVAALKALLQAEQRTTQESAAQKNQQRPGHEQSMQQEVQRREQEQQSASAQAEDSSIPAAVGRLSSQQTPKAMA